MTHLEKYMKAYPGADITGIIRGDCPPGLRELGNSCDISLTCEDCWKQEIPEEKPLVYAHMGPALAEVKRVIEEDSGVTVTAEPIIKDSGDRTEFSTGAVRDMREGKGRCDLMPLDVVAAFISDFDEDLDTFLWNIHKFQETNQESYLYSAIHHFGMMEWGNDATMFLEVAKHFEDGAKKYGEWNWTRGIPTHCYIDSAVRHYLKYRRGDQDEPHSRAVVWNLLCCIWTIRHAQELGYPELVSKAWKK